MEAIQVLHNLIQSSRVHMSWWKGNVSQLTHTVCSCSRWRGTQYSVSFLWMEQSWPQEAPPALLTSTTTTMPARCTPSVPTASPACVCLSIPSCLRLLLPATGLARSRSGTEWTTKYRLKSLKDVACWHEMEDSTKLKTHVRFHLQDFISHNLLA